MRSLGHYIILNVPCYIYFLTTHHGASAGPLLFGVNCTFHLFSVTVCVSENYSLFPSTACFSSSHPYRPTNMVSPEHEGEKLNIKDM